MRMLRHNRERKYFLLMRRHYVVYSLDLGLNSFFFIFSCSHTGAWGSVAKWMTRLDTGHNCRQSYGSWISTTDNFYSCGLSRQSLCFPRRGSPKITSYVEGQSRKCTRRSRGRGGECGEEGCAGKRDEAEEVGVHNSKGIKHPATERSLDTLYRAPRGWMGQVQ